MNNIPLISIIIPVYNVEKYLNQCIESVINQSYKNLEIILVNDGSTDNSGKICNNYKNIDDRIRVIHKENDGIANARNSGLKIAKGEYVFFIDSDDYMGKNLIGNLCKAMKKGIFDTIISGYKRVIDNEKIIDIISYEEIECSQVNDIKELIPRFIGSLPQTSDSFISVVWGNLYSMKLINKYNIQFVSEREIFSEDLVFLIDYLIHSKGVKIISNADYMYRCNNSSFTQTYKPNLFEKSKILYYYMIDKIKNYNLSNHSILRLQKRMFIYLRNSISMEQKRTSHKIFSECINRLDIICNDDLIIDIIKEYPISQLKFKQKVFMFMIKYKLTYMLYFLFKSNLG